MASISLRSVSKRYRDGTVAVRDFGVEISDGEFMILVGPSGCGKTTLLRMIAGHRRAARTLRLRALELVIYSSFVQSLEA